MASLFDDPAIIEAMQAEFRATPIHALLGIEYLGPDAPELADLDAVDAIEEGEVIVQMPVRPEAFGTGGNLHGGAIATLIDVAAATCAARSSAFEWGVNSLVTADIHVRYLGRPQGDMVFARARLVKAGRQLIVVACRVVDRAGTVIAHADFSSMLVPLRKPLLAPDAGADAAPHSPEL